MRWPWDVKVDIRQSIVGDRLHGRQTVTMTLHSGLKPLDYILLYLKRQQGGSYYVNDTYSWVTLDQKGRLVMPLFGPEHVRELSEDGAVRQGIQDLMEPIRYRLGNVGTFDMSEQEFDRIPQGWVRRTRGGVAALKGLVVEDFVKLQAKQPGALCGKTG